MIDTALALPEREAKPRRRGLTMVIDPGLPTGRFEDAVESVGEYVDLVKFGWGTALVTRDIKRKIDIVRSAGIDWYLGGTLFERYAQAGLVGEWTTLCHVLGAEIVEVSNGTIAMTHADKAGWVSTLAAEFVVISEVGAKDEARSESLTPEEWIDCIQRDLAAGARLVTTEARESGRAGLCRSDGEPRHDLVTAILGSGVDRDRLLFEAPTKDLQVYFIRLLDAGANLGNVRVDDVIGLETLRLGLRSDTMPTV